METTEPDTRQSLIGFAFIVLASIGFSSKSILIKLVYADSAHIDAITLMTLRMLLALPFFLGVALWNPDPRAGEPRPSDWTAVVLLGVTGYYLASLLDLTGLMYISAGLERLILFLYPTIVVLLTAVIYRRPVSQAQRRALLLSYSGILLVFTNRPLESTPDLVLGALLVFASAVTFALYMTGSGHVIPRFGSRRFTAYTMTIASLATGVHFTLSTPLDRLLVSGNVFGLALLLALFATVIPAFLMNAGIHRIGSGQASIVSSVGPVATLALAYAVLGETLGPVQLLGSTMVLGGILLVSRGKQTPDSPTGHCLKIEETKKNDPSL